MFPHLSRHPRLVFLTVIHQGVYYTHSLPNTGMHANTILQSYTRFFGLAKFSKEAWLQMELEVNSLFYFLFKYQETIY